MHNPFADLTALSAAVPPPSKSGAATKASKASALFDRAKFPETVKAADKACSYVLVPFLSDPADPAAQALPVYVPEGLNDTHAYAFGWKATFDDAKKRLYFSKVANKAEKAWTLPSYNVADLPVIKKAKKAAVKKTIKGKKSTKKASSKKAAAAGGESAGTSERGDESSSEESDKEVGADDNETAHPEEANTSEGRLRFGFDDCAHDDAVDLADDSLFIRPVPQHHNNIPTSAPSASSYYVQPYDDDDVMRGKEVAQRDALLDDLLNPDVVIPKEDDDLDQEDDYFKSRLEELLQQQQQQQQPDDELRCEDDMDGDDGAGYGAYVPLPPTASVKPQSSMETPQQDEAVEEDGPSPSSYPHDHSQDEDTMYLQHMAPSYSPMQYGESLSQKPPTRPFSVAESGESVGNDTSHNVLSAEPDCGDTDLTLQQKESSVAAVLSELILDEAQLYQSKEELVGKELAILLQKKALEDAESEVGLRLQQPQQQQQQQSPRRRVPVVTVADDLGPTTSSPEKTALEKLLASTEAEERGKNGSSYRSNTTGNLTSGLGGQTSSGASDFSSSVDDRLEWTATSPSHPFSQVSVSASSQSAAHSSLASQRADNNTSSAVSITSPSLLSPSGHNGLHLPTFPVRSNQSDDLSQGDDDVASPTNAPHTSFGKYLRKDSIVLTLHPDQRKEYVHEALPGHTPSSSEQRFIDLSADVKNRHFDHRDGSSNHPMFSSDPTVPLVPSPPKQPLIDTAFAKAAAAASAGERPRRQPQVRFGSSMEPQAAPQQTTVDESASDALTDAVADLSKKFSNAAAAEAADKWLRRNSNDSYDAVVKNASNATMTYSEDADGLPPLAGKSHSAFGPDVVSVGIDTSVASPLLPSRNPSAFPDTGCLPQLHPAGSFSESYTGATFSPALPHLTDSIVIARQPEVHQAFVREHQSDEFPFRTSRRDEENPPHAVDPAPTVRQQLHPTLLVSPLASPLEAYLPRLKDSIVIAHHPQEHRAYVQEHVESIHELSKLERAALEAHRQRFFAAEEHNSRAAQEQQLMQLSTDEAIARLQGLKRHTDLLALSSVSQSSSQQQAAQAYPRYLERGSFVEESLDKEVELNRLRSEARQKLAERANNLLARQQEAAAPVPPSTRQPPPAPTTDGVDYGASFEHRLGTVMQRLLAQDALYLFQQALDQQMLEFAAWSLDVMKLYQTFVDSKPPLKKEVAIQAVEIKPVMVESSTNAKTAPSFTPSLSLGDAATLSQQPHATTTASAGDDEDAFAERLATIRLLRENAVTTSGNTLTSSTPLQGAQQSWARNPVTASVGLGYYSPASLQHGDAVAPLQMFSPPPKVPRNSVQAPYRQIYTPPLPLDLRTKDAGAALHRITANLRASTASTPNRAVAFADTSSAASSTPPPLETFGASPAPVGYNGQYAPIATPPPLPTVDSAPKLQVAQSAFLRWDIKRSGNVLVSQSGTMVMSDASRALHAIREEVRANGLQASPKVTIPMYALGSIGIAQGDFVFEIRFEAKPSHEVFTATGPTGMSSAKKPMRVHSNGFAGLSRLKAPASPFYVGVASKYYKGPHRSSAAYLYCSDGTIVASSNEVKGVPYATRLHASAIVTVHLSFSRRELSFAVDGVPQGVAFKFQQQEDPEPLFPLVVFMGDGDSCLFQPPTFSSSLLVAGALHAPTATTPSKVNRTLY